MYPPIEEAKRILNGEQALLEGRRFHELIQALKGELEFGSARRLLALARDRTPEDVWIIQQLALCTYKDEELPHANRFADALELLKGIGLCGPANRDAETLALGGAVYKRLWEQFGQLEHLHEALALYRAAYERNPEQDLGYGGVNAAFVLDLLASRSQGVAARTGTEPVEAEARRAQAHGLRQSMATAVARASERDPSLRDRYWYVATLAEIHFGLGDYPTAGDWLARAGALPSTEWEKQSTFRQLVAIARHQGVEPPAEHSTSAHWHPAWQALAGLLGDQKTGPALSCYRGKVGLALSGGGLRASFFHLGVLARLAEMDVLRGVEVLSTVSGGSIVGAHYYLAVQHWLQTQPDDTITRDDYQEIVRRVQDQFLAGVQKNLRTQALASFTRNLRMIVSKAYSRSHRLGELYEEALFAQVADNHAHGTPRTLPDLLIKPEGDPGRDRFKPRFSNWRRRAKVPVLLLNATSLNNGHGWQFSARWMGEPPGLVGEEVDSNERYRRAYYPDMPTEPLRTYRLGYAVAASACVPGLFEPLVIDGLYPDRTVRLVDGGVYDNQGLAGLLDEGCTLVLCSDASGQMDDQHSPADGVLGVPLRANSILMKRLREIQCQDLKGRLDSQALQGLFLVHLKKDLAARPLDWIGCQDPTPWPLSTGNTTPYGVDKELQHQLAAIRTDLDSFSEVEAYALMLSGYLMTEHQFKELQRQHEAQHQPGTWGEFDIHAPRGDWPFLALAPIVGLPPDSQDLRRQDLGRQLEVGASRLFKAWKLIPALRVTSRVVGAAVVLLWVTLLWSYWDTPLLSPSITVGQTLLLLLLTMATLVMPALKWLNPESAMRGYLRKTLIALAGYILAKVHLGCFDRLFLKRGRLSRLLGLKRSSP